MANVINVGAKGGGGGDDGEVDGSFVIGTSETETDKGGTDTENHVREGGAKGLE